MAANRVVVQEGYTIPFAGFDGYKRKRKSSRKGGRSKMGRAAKHCKGKKRGAFRTCIKEYFKKH